MNQPQISCTDHALKIAKCHTITWPQPRLGRPKMAPDPCDRRIGESLTAKCAWRACPVRCLLVMRWCCSSLGPSSLESHLKQETRDSWHDAFETGGLTYNVFGLMLRVFQVTQQMIMFRMDQWGSQTVVQISPGFLWNSGPIFWLYGIALTTKNHDASCVYIPGAVPSNFPNFRVSAEVSRSQVVSIAMNSKYHGEHTVYFSEILHQLGTVSNYW